VIASYLEMGASGCQLGTRFVCAHESQAHPKFKEAFIRANARDAISSIQLDPRFPVIPVRAINNQASVEFQTAQREIIDRFQRGEVDQHTAQLEIEYYWAGALKRAVVDGDIERGSLMAGQSVGMVKELQSMDEIMRELISQAENALES
jgi:enoyl-[acyl-carrier protein] reductase II